MLNGIERLRDCAKIRAITVLIDKTELLDQLDAIEREVEERYVELPVDADGKPIPCYSEVISGERTVPNDVPLTVVGVSGEQVVVNYHDDCGIYHETRVFADSCRLYNPPTVEDVLEEYRVKYYDLVTDMECKNITNEEYVQGIKELNEMFAAKLQLREAK